MVHHAAQCLHGKCGQRGGHKLMLTDHAPPVRPPQCPCVPFLCLVKHHLGLELLDAVHKQ